MGKQTRRIVTLEQFIIENELETPGATGEFSQLLRDISLASRIVNREVNKAGLVNILGITGDENVQGETVQKLDVFANDQFIDALTQGGQTCVIGSEENEEVIPVLNSQSRGARYVVLMDPLDGSSNIDVNVSIGTIFSILERVTPPGQPGATEDCLQAGSKQVAAGYVIYGSSTMLVYTTGDGVNGFTLDPSLGEFLLSHPNITLPDTCKMYSLNEGNYRQFHPGIKAYLRFIKGKKEGGEYVDPENRLNPYSGRYIGSLVADFHRNLLRGGIFLYPALSSAMGGKLRLLYEANPMAMLISQAGGMATNGKENILDIVPASLHERTPLFIGPAAEVERIHEFLGKEYPKEEYPEEFFAEIENIN